MTEPEKRGDNAQTAVQVSETAEKEEKEWNKTRQQIEQERANRVKVEKEKDLLAAQYSQQQGEMAKLKDRISELETRKMPELGDTVDEDVRKYSTAVNAELMEARKTLRLMQDELKVLKDQQAEAAKLREREELVNELMGPLDKKYGAQFHSEAYDLAQEKVKSGESDDPKDKLAAYLLLESCYQELTEKAKNKTKKESPPVTDTGEGFSGAWLNDVKEGSLAEVLAEARKKGLKGLRK